MSAKDAEEIELEKAVFGDFEGFEEGLRDLQYISDEIESESEESQEELQGEANSISEVQDDQLFFVDQGDEEEKSLKGSDSDEDMSGSDSDSSASSILEVDGGKAAWIDSDDDRLNVSLVSSDRTKKLRLRPEEGIVSGKEYSKRLRQRFVEIYKVPKWAKNRGNDDNDSEGFSGSDVDMDEEDGSVHSDPLQDLLQKAPKYTRSGSSKMLPPSTIDISRLKDANSSAPSQSAIQTLDFHPSHPLLLSSGYDRTLRMYYVDGKTNAVVTSLHVRKSPFQTASFHVDGKRVFAAGRRRYMYIWDIETGSAEKITRLYGHEDSQKSFERFKLSPCGRYVGLIGSGGWMNVLSSSTGQWIAGAKVEGSIADIAWDNTGNSATIVNKDGDVWEWDSVAGRFANRWTDQGGVGITSMALSSRFCAIGSRSGIVNIYDRKKASDGPKNVLSQLTTPISSLEFSLDGQILSMASRAKKDAFRLVHVPSFSVFKNWPTSGTPLGRVTAAKFSPGSEMLVTGNSQGKARLWRLNHY